MDEHTIPAQLDEVVSRLAVVEDNQDVSAARMTRVELSLAENTKCTKQIAESVAGMADMRDAWELAVGGLKVLEKIGNMAKPVGYIAAAIVACGGAWAGFKGWFK